MSVSASISHCAQPKHNCYCIDDIHDYSFRNFPISTHLNPQSMGELSLETSLVHLGSKCPLGNSGERAVWSGFTLKENPRIKSGWHHKPSLCLFGLTRQSAKPNGKPLDALLRRQCSGRCKCKTHPATDHHRTRTGWQSITYEILILLADLGLLCIESRYMRQLLGGLFQVCHSARSDFMTWRVEWHI